MRVVALVGLSLSSLSTTAQPLQNFTRFQRTVLPWLTPLSTLPGADPTTLAAACLNLNSTSSGAPPPPCTWTAALSNYYLPGCSNPPTPNVNCIHFDTLAEAQGACAADADCGGVTSQDGGVPPWELRRGPTPTFSGLGEISYAIANARACHPVASACNAFTTDGKLFHCPGGYCDCDSGQQYCARGRDIFSGALGENATDLYIQTALLPPPEWAAGVAAGSMLFAQPPPNTCYMPEVGNGHLATVVSWGALHMAGLFNGACGSTQKARLPSPVALSLPGGVLTGSALDMARGAFLRRWAMPGGSAVEQRIWAHRTRKRVLVTDFKLLSGPGGEFPLASAWDSSIGNGCAGSFSNDIVWGVPSGGAAPQIWLGNTTRLSDAGQRPNVSIALDALPAAITLTPTAPTLRLLSAFAASLDFPGGEAPAPAVAALAAAEYASASASAPGALWEEHAAAWAALNAAGIDVEPASADPGDAARAGDVAAHANASQYFLFSSLRGDAVAGISPGGLSTENYQGAVFMDADWWMEPPLYFLAPDLAGAILQYRFLSLPVMRDLAARFGFGGYGGAMAAWTAAYLGNPFGCCSASGGYEDCLEHHVTGDIAFSAWQYYSATGDVEWLGGVGWALLSATADYHLSRVSPPPPALASLVRDTQFHVLNVLPIDEWSVGSGCGSEDPGVQDDAQMNGVVKASLLLAARAARVLGNVTARSALWEAVGTNVVLLYNASHGHHNQFTSPPCPGGWGGSHYSPSHTVCPSDVEHLTYPLGDVLNTSAADSRADAELFIPLTCRENAGMTTPMHTVVWLQLGEAALAQAEFNRSMHAACYGPFNVRNEVDKHADIPGGHFDNTVRLWAWGMEGTASPPRPFFFSLPPLFISWMPRALNTSPPPPHSLFICAALFNWRRGLPAGADEWVGRPQDHRGGAEDAAPLPARERGAAASAPICVAGGAPHHNRGDCAANGGPPGCP